MPKLKVSTVLSASFVFFILCGDAIAGFSCSGILTDSQTEGFKAMFTPPYSPGLSHVGGAVKPDNMFKKLNKDELGRLKVKEPIVATSTKLSDDRAKILKGWLNESAGQSLPGWISTVLGIAAPSAWIGVAADVLMQMVNASGDAGRIDVANIAGTVSGGGQVGVLEQVSNDSNGKLKFTYVYVYKYNLNGKNITTPLKICSADVLTS